MGFFGPTIRERSRGGRIQYYGKCEECRNEHTDDDKKRVVRKLEDCARKDKKQKRDDAKEAADKAREDADVKSKREKAIRQAKVDRIKNQRLQKAKQIRRNAKGKTCPFCGKNPCRGTRPDCAAVKAAEFESSMNIDVSDPATFDAQLKFYRDEM
jgi:hypothetical protein